MAATASIGYSRSVPFTSSEYAVPVRYPMGYSRSYHVGYPNDNFHVHSLSKRSPVAPFKPVNPFIAALTLGIPFAPPSILFAAPINKKTCKFTFCKNKKKGLVL